LAFDPMNAVLPWWSRYSRPLLVTFPAANTRRDIAHTLTVVPSGYVVLWADAEIHATPGVLWTPDVAYLQANAANAHALLLFLVTREEAVVV